jgi:hypothetical protein
MDYLPHFLATFDKSHVVFIFESREDYPTGGLNFLDEVLKLLARHRGAILVFVGVQGDEDGCCCCYC